MQLNGLDSFLYLVSKFLCLLLSAGSTFSAGTDNLRGANPKFAKIARREKFCPLGGRWRPECLSPNKSANTSRSFCVELALFTSVPYHRTVSMDLIIHLIAYVDT